MKILFFIDSLAAGGRERRLVELLFYLKKQVNYEICLVLTEESMEYTYVRNLQISLHIIKRKLTKYDPSMFYRFYRIAKQFKPDIIHSWSMMTTWYSIPTKLLLKKPLLANLIADSKDISKMSIIKRFFFQVDFKFADVILGNSKAGFNAYGMRDNDRTYLIYNGVRLERFSRVIDIEKTKKKLNIKARFIILMVASASKNKDYDLFLDIAGQINSANRDVLFLGVGDGSELERLNRRIACEHIKNVNLVGRRNDVEELCALADICLLLTHGEGISNSIIEYMATGKPVITTDAVGGSREIIEDGKSGYIMQSKEDLVAKITELLNNEKLRQKLGERGRNIIYEKFAIEKMGKEYEILYKKYS